MPDAINLAKQIKRHLIGRRQNFFAVTAPGLEALCVREIAALSDTVQVEATYKGGVAFSGRLDDLYRANLQLRTAGRILLRLAGFKATNFRQLEKKIAQTAWDRYIPEGCVPACKVSAHRSRLFHSQAVAQTVARAIHAYWQDHGAAPQEDSRQNLHILLDHDNVLLSLDSSGPNLHRRGLKTHPAAAPLRETLAAAVLQLAQYDPGRPLLDPMCGSGSFALEAALMAKQIPAGHSRDFAFMQWPSFGVRRWQHLKAEAAKQIRSFEQPVIHASDIDPQMCRLLSDCIRRNGLADAVTVRCDDFFALRPPPGPAGLIVLNPPYGRRLQPRQDQKTFYRRIGEKLAGDFKGWRAAWIVPPALIREAALELKPLAFGHGGLSLTLLTGVI